MMITRVLGTDAPQFVQPKLRKIDYTFDELAELLALHREALATANQPDAADPEEFYVNGMLCRPTGTSLYGWVLVEVQEADQPKGFYLLPGTARDWDDHEGKAPYFEFSGQAAEFDEEHNSGADAVRIHLIALQVLATVIHHRVDYQPPAEDA